MNSVKLVTDDLVLAGQVMLGMYGMKRMFINTKGELVIEFNITTHVVVLSKTPMTSIEIFKSILSTKRGIELSDIDSLAYIPYTLRLGDDFTVIVASGDTDVFVFQYDAEQAPAEPQFLSPLSRMLSTYNGTDQQAFRLDYWKEFEKDAGVTNLTHWMAAMDPLQALFSRGFVYTSARGFELGDIAKPFERYIRGCLDVGVDTYDLIVELSNEITHTSNNSIGCWDKNRAEMVAIREIMLDMVSNNVKLVDHQFVCNGVTMPRDYITALAKRDTI